MTGNILAEFQNVDGDAVGPAIDLPVAVTVPQLNALINKLLDNDDTLPYSFLVNDAEVTESVAHSLAEHGLSRETTLQIVFQPQAVFRVRSVTRCGATLPGHDEAVLSVHFSPNGQRLASGAILPWNGGGRSVGGGLFVCLFFIPAIGRFVHAMRTDSFW